jgi:hypothetical protein
VLDPKALRPGRNVVAIYAKLLCEAEKKEQRVQCPRQDRSRVQVVGPAPAWERSVFHGLAQVIVQFTEETGEIRWRLRLRD